MARKRRFRDNIWFGHRKGHRKAALKGWRKRGHKRSRGRKCRSNPASITAAPMKAVTSAFSKDLLVRGGVIVAGNLATTLAADALISRVDMLKNKWVNVVTVLVTAGVAGTLAKKYLPKYGDDILLGGMLAGLTRGLKTAFPNQFGNLSGDDDLDGLDDFVNPNQVMRPIGMNDYADPRQLMAPIGVSGFGDSATVPQATRAMQLDGLADMAVAEEIEAQA
jgi:hypothetical protein